ncbi:peptidoglycan-binding protein LysM [bacterium]|nr:peptidoglycan-binding protein LysM [candidate division CSSED10-310 bacterium]
MGVFDFIKEAGKKIGIAEPEVKAQGATMTNADYERKLRKEVEALGLAIENLDIQFARGIVMVGGTTVDQASREKAVLALGNVEGVAQVRDNLVLATPVSAADAAATTQPETVFYTVKPGDTLSKIAKQHYGDAMKYTAIFEANKPMLIHPDRIYPGQVLRIPKR